MVTSGLKGVGIKKMKVELPKNMTCTQCILQYTYTSGIQISHSNSFSLSYDNILASSLLETKMMIMIKFLQETIGDLVLNRLRYRLKTVWIELGNWDVEIRYGNFFCFY